MKSGKKGFTLMEMLIVVAIIAVLIAIAIPTFSAQMEKSRETTDLANARIAYAQVMTAALVEDTSSPAHQSGTYQMFVDLKQVKNGWSLSAEDLNVAGIRPGDVHWKGAPRAKGRCRIYYLEDGMYISWGADIINQATAADFLTKEHLQSILGDRYPYNVINSNEPYSQGQGTKNFLDFAKQNGFDLKDYEAMTWQIYAKEPGSSDILSVPAIYWSTLDVTGIEVDKNNPVSVPVIGYRDGKYDVYAAPVVTYNEGKPNEYNSIQNGFANVTEDGGKASFQFDNYDDAKAAYDELMKVYEANGTVSRADLIQMGLQ